MDFETPDTERDTDVQPDDAATSEPAEVEHSLKQEFREGAAKVVGFAVEAATLLSGSSGDLVDAQRDVAEAETEEFLDRVDGEG